MAFLERAFTGNSNDRIFSDGFIPGLEVLATEYPEKFPIPTEITGDQAKVVARLTASYVMKGMSNTHTPEDIDGTYQRQNAEVELRRLCGNNVDLMVGLTRLALETASESLSSAREYRKRLSNFRYK